MTAEMLLDKLTYLIKIHGGDLAVHVEYDGLDEEISSISCEPAEPLETEGHYGSKMDRPRFVIRWKPWGGGR